MDSFVFRRRPSPPPKYTHTLVSFLSGRWFLHLTYCSTFSLMCGMREGWIRMLSRWHRWFHLPSLTPSLSSKCHKLSSYIFASLESSFCSTNLFVFCCWHKKTHVTLIFQCISNSNRITSAKLFLFSGFSSLFMHIRSSLWILGLYGLSQNCRIKPNSMINFGGDFYWD